MTSYFSLFFIPQEKNNFRARALQPGFLAFLIAIYLLNQSVLKSLTVFRPGILGYSSEITSAKVLLLTNQERQKLDLKPLRINPVLNQSAAAKAADMFAQNYWAHNSPDNKTPWTFFKQAGYQYSVAGENLAKDFYDTDSMVVAWMNSPTHRDNILNSKYQEIGIGVVNGVLNGVQTTLVVQHFGTPLGIPVNDQETATANNKFLDKELAATPLQSTVLAQSAVINPLTITKTISLLLFGLIVFALLVDAFVTLRNKSYRLVGSTFGHISFLAVIILLLLFTQQGSVF